MDLIAMILSQRGNKINTNFRFCTTELTNTVNISDL